MNILHTVAELRAALPGRQSVLVPTMGNLHDGHLALVRGAAAIGRPVVVSIFVNRLQFAPHEDFDRYPRTLERDCELLRQTPCDLVFAPDEREMYPEPQGFKVHPPAPLADVLEGASRPGFFVGVCTVVSKLFNYVQPAHAIFGRKDYQQWMVLRAMVRQMGLPIEIHGSPTVRADDGLALSSRNGYLDAARRAEAPRLYATLTALRDQILAGARDYERLQQEAAAVLTAHGWQPDYLSVRSRHDLSPAGGDPAGRSVIVAAARLGNTRLIDNLEF